MDILDLLINYIESKGLSQSAFARKLRYSEATLSKIINRKSPLTKPFQRKFLLSEGFEVKDLLQKDATKVAFRKDENIKDKIILCLSMIDENNSGLKFLEAILGCIENKMIEYIKHKRGIK